MSKTHKSVLDMVQSLSQTKELPESLKNQVRRRAVVKKLMAVRAAKDLSQLELSKKMQCSQSRISKLESSEDRDLRLGDVRDYLRAMNMDARILICPREWHATDQVKFHAFQIRDCLDRLVKMANDDEHINLGVQRFHVEALCNLVRLVAESSGNLPELSVDSPNVLEADPESEYAAIDVNQEDGCESMC